MARGGTKTASGAALAGPAWLSPAPIERPWHDSNVRPAA